jgi:hypothetical protein
VRRCLLLLGLALCVLAHGATPPRVDLSATAAWKAWSRPGRATEVDIRLSSDAATRVIVDVVAGRQTVRAELDLEPGRVARLQVPVASTERISVSAAAPGGSPARREVAVAQSESPLLGVALVADAPVPFDGFHTVALAADDLPRNAAAYSSLDALMLDAATLAALDPRQLGALLNHAAACGRIVVVNADPAVRRVLDGAGGCGGRALLTAGALPEARQLLATSLATSLPAAMSPAGIGELARPDHGVWSRLAVAFAIYFAAASMALMFFSSLPALLLMPGLAAVTMLALLHGMKPPSQVVVWSEGDSGARVARYQAWQRFPGVVRERARVPIAPQLAPSVQACDPAQVVRLDFDARRGHASFAEFETRLFRQTALCYWGSFPMSRSMVVDTRPSGERQVRNAGPLAWPRGVLLAGGLVHDLPALAPGMHWMLAADAGQPPGDAAARTAMTRTAIDTVSALWALDLGGVADIPIEAKGWLLVAAPPP